MSEFLDPRSDIVFKEIFMDHQAILKSFLNSVLLFKSESEWIANLCVVPPEEMPQLHTLKDTCVDVNCFDASGRHFVVEMQMNGTTAFVRCRDFAHAHERPDL